MIRAILLCLMLGAVNTAMADEAETDWYALSNSSAPLPKAYEWLENLASGHYDHPYFSTQLRWYAEANEIGLGYWQLGFTISIPLDR